MMQSIEGDSNPENPKEVKKGFEATITFGRYAGSSEIADMTLFLASAQSESITGRAHVVDGGMLTA